MLAVVSPESSTLSVSTPSGTAGSPPSMFRRPLIPLTVGRLMITVKRWVSARLRLAGLLVSAQRPAANWTRTSPVPNEPVTL